MAADYPNDAVEHETVQEDVASGTVVHANGHSYPSAYAPAPGGGLMNDVWCVLDTLRPGRLSTAERALLAGMFTGMIHERERRLVTGTIHERERQFGLVAPTPVAPAPGGVGHVGAAGNSGASVTPVTIPRTPSPTRRGRAHITGNAPTLPGELFRASSTNANGTQTVVWTSEPARRRTLLFDFRQQPVLDMILRTPRVGQPTPVSLPMPRVIFEHLYTGDELTVTNVYVMPENELIDPDSSPLMMGLPNLIDGCQVCYGTAIPDSTNPSATFWNSVFTPEAVMSAVRLAEAVHISFPPDRDNHSLVQEWIDYWSRQTNAYDIPWPPHTYGGRMRSIADRTGLLLGISTYDAVIKLRASISHR